MSRDRSDEGGRAFQASPDRSAESLALLVTAVLALLFLALHLPYLPASLEDLDSINFALGVRRFDVAHHQPHPPGYPVYIAVAKAVRAVAPSEVAALGLVSIISGALGVLALGVLFRRLERDAGSPAWPLAATAVAMASPLYWFSAARPLSDTAGLAAALGVQLMTLSASSAGALTAAAFAAGLAAGLRSQVVWLTVPLLIVKGLEASPRPPASSLRPLASFTAGGLLWFVPLVAMSGGPSAYWHALFDQGAEDLGNIQMLWTRHDARALVDALYYAFVAPWAAWPMAAVVLVLGLAGAVWAWRRAPHALVWLVAGFGPYLLFDLLFQETFTGRYALPLVIPMAYLAVAGARVLPRQTGLVVAIAVAMFGAHVGGTSIAAYSRQKAPAFRLLDDMQHASRSASERPVLAMDRRESLDLRRPIAWAGDAMRNDARTLSAPPQHEWLEPVKYWNTGGRAPLWFVVDPMRTTIDLVQHGAPMAYRWSLPYPVLMSGVRPNEMDWYRVDRPDWYVGEGWSLTPESAGVAEVDRHGLAYGPIRGWMRSGGRTMMIGGRNFEPTIQPRLTVTVNGNSTPVSGMMVPPGPFLYIFGAPSWDDDLDYITVDVASSLPARIAIEQFDVSPTRTVFAFGEGWHEQEFNPRTGLRWRWLGERGEVKLVPRTSRLTLHLEGESPRTYFARGSRLVIRSRDRVLFDRVLTDDFSVDVPIADGAETLLLETDQVFAPADRSSRSADHRHLGLRIFKCEIRPSSQGTASAVPGVDRLLGQAEQRAAKRQVEQP